MISAQNNYGFANLLYTPSTYIGICSKKRVRVRDEVTCGMEDGRKLFPF